ncbi:hypothetical protein ACFX1S_035682 [Malus domestica]
MDFATIQAQLAELTAQLSQYAERTTMQNVLTCGSSIDYDRIFDEINSLVQGSQNQTKEAQQDGYWQRYEEFYLTPMQPPQLPIQQFQSNSSMSTDSDQIFQLLTSLVQG